MPPLECHRVWTLLSTGAGDGYQTYGRARDYTFYLEVTGSSRSTVAVRIETARQSSGISSAVRWQTVGSTYSLSSASMSYVQFSGPMLAVRPYVTAMGSTGAAGSTGVSLIVEMVGI